ncbi:MAG TPA: fibrobacter succinogenes major paralogous domain-containing protein [Bacteroidales bacterium]|nr:fibrobacter succinogenes major paralogous domain-containing protein [Bacteroidales bacterium]
MLIKRIINKLVRIYKSIVFDIGELYLKLIHKKGLVTDNEGKVYETILIGKQQWMAENLAVSKFANGDIIPFINNDAAWQEAGKNGQPAWCYYKDDSESEKFFGKLYNWYAVTDKRGLAPEGWSVPSDEEWVALIGYSGGESTAGKILKSRTGWKNGGNGSNKSGFNALPGGYRDPDGVFGNGGFGRWWSATEASSEKAWRFRLGFDNNTINRFDGPKGYGFSIRCIRNF